MVILVAIGTACYLAYFVLRAKFGFVLALIGQLTLSLIGLLIYTSEGDVPWSVPLLYACSIAGVLIAVAIPFKSPSTPSALRRFGAAPSQVIWAMVLFAGTLSIYHLAKAGIPILSGSIERQRFDFTSSGLFGVPGRMFLFGNQLAWAAAGVNATALGVRWSGYGPWRVATAFLVVATLLSGFKGALLSTAIVSASMYVAVTGVELRLGSVLRRYWWVVIPPVVYFFAIATLYTTYSASGDPLIVQLFDRATVVAAEPAKVVLNGELPHIHATLFDEFRYFFTRYTGGNTFGMVPLERSVSASIIHANPYSSDWAPPVTVSGFAELTYHFGPIAGIVGVALAGRWLALCGRGTSRTAVGMWVKLVLALAVYDWALKGGLAYYAINPLMVAIMLGLVGGLAWLVFGSRAKTPTTARQAAPLNEALNL